MLEFAPRTERTTQYDDAILYCTFCRHNGHSDWRLPTYDEWDSISVIPWGVWFLNRGTDSNTWFVLPVRDIC